MCLRWLVFYLTSVGCVSAAGNCSYKALITNLGLDSDDIQMTSIRPVTNWRNATTVFINLFVTSITEVDVKAQSFTTQITFLYGWLNDFTVWDPDDFCGISTCSIKKDMVWNPEIIIVESIKTEFAAMENQYVQLLNVGVVLSSNTFTVTTACKMNLHQFPFDVQTCNLTLQSPTLSLEELVIMPFSDASFLTLSSKKAFQTQGEWELLSINISKASNSFIGPLQDQLIYEITMKRKPLLYVINFLMPVFYFLILDLASFFVDPNEGEKLGFKVTLLLAISVLLLMLKDMLPSTTSDIPLIGIYCVVIFTLIGASVLETILVNFLLDKGYKTDSKAPIGRSTLSDGGKDSEGPADSDVKEEKPFTLEGFRQILMEVQAASHQTQQKKQCLSWIRVARIIDAVFFFLYVLSVIVFLVSLFMAWF